MDLLKNNMEGVSEELKFDALPSEVLLEIYSHLSPADALQMFEVNKRCRDILKKDLRFQSASLRNVSLRNFNGEEKMTLKMKRHVKYICIEGIRLILRFLRIYWNELLVVHISCYQTSPFFQFVVYTYIVEYRRDQIKNLSISFLTYEPNLPIRPFRNLISVRFKACHFSNYLSRISELFPYALNIEFLKFNDFDEGALLRIIRSTFPYLRYMRVSPYSLTKIQLTLLELLNPHVFFGYHDRV